MTDTKNADDAWEDFHVEKAKSTYPKWPNELLLKLCFGSYLERRLALDASMSVLDVGCGFGNNLLPFLDAGCKGAGTEVTDETAKLAQDILKDRGYESTIRAGHNQELPFDDNQFDILLSINVLHYEKTEDDIHASLREYSRVMKPDGAMILFTVGPEHSIYKKAQNIGPHQYVVQNFDFRDGEQYFYFDNLKYLNYYVSQYFGDVELGRSTEVLMSKPLDFLIAVARNKRESA